MHNKGNEEKREVKTKSRSKVKVTRYGCKGLAASNTYVKYEKPQVKG